MDGNFTVISNEEAALFKKLQAFYLEVRELTLETLNVYPVVYPYSLNAALRRVNADWIKEEDPTRIDISLDK